MGVIISLIRNGIGGVLVFFDIITRGTKLKRSPQAQQQIATELKG